MAEFDTASKDFVLRSVVYSEAFERGENPDAAVDKIMRSRRGPIESLKRIEELRNPEINEETQAVMAKMIAAEGSALFHRNADETLLAMGRDTNGYLFKP